MDGFVLAIIIIAAVFILIAVSVSFFVRKNRRRAVEHIVEVEPAEIVPITAPQMSVQPSTDMLALVEKIEIANRSGQSLMLSSVDRQPLSAQRSSNRNHGACTAIGASLRARTMAVLAEAQTLAQSRKPLQNGLFQQPLR